jgi:hypothetical protein
MKNLILILFIVATMAAAAKPAKPITIEICNSRFCYIQKIEHVVRYEKITDAQDKEYMRFYQSDGRITDIKTDGTTVTIKK